MIRLGILGTGAMARYYAYLFSPLHPIMVGRYSGPFLLVQDGMEYTVNPRVISWSEATPSLFDVVILAVKWPAMPIVRTFLQQASPDLLVISLMNGMGQEEALIPPLTPEQLMVGITTDAVTGYWDKQTTWPAARVSAKGQCFVPTIPHPLWPFWQQQLQTLNIRNWTVLSPAMIRRERWIKLILNSIINPLTALANVTNGELLKIPLWLTSQPLLNEAQTVSQALGISVGDDLPSRLIELCQATQSNKSSMLQDVERHRPTEIDAINGYLIKMAHQYQVNVPTHRAIIQVIHSMDPHEE